MERRKFNRLVITFVVICAVVAFMFYRGINQTGIFNYAVLLVIIIYVLYKGVNQEFILNPYILFALTPITLLIYDVNVSTHYLQSLNQNTYNICFYNFILLLAGFSFANRFRFKKSESAVWSKGDNLSSDSCTRYAYIMLVLGLYPTIYGCITGMGYLLSMNLSGMKEAVNAAPLCSIFQLFAYPSIICAIQSKRRKTIVVVSIALIASMFLNFSKTTLVMLAVSILLVVYNQSKLQNRKMFKVMLITTIALIAFYYSFDFYNSIRHDYDTNQYFSDLGYVGNVTQSWFLPIMYLISPWGNLQYIIDTTVSHAFGLWAIKPFLGYLQIDTLFSSQFALKPMYTAFNTFSYISCFYRDFGFLGSGVESFVLGYFIMRIYKMFLAHRKSPFMNAIYALNIYATVMLFFNNHYLQLSYPITIVILMWLYSRFFVKREDNLYESAKKFI